MRKRALAIGAAVLLCVSMSPAAYAKKCTDKQAEAADAMIDHLDSWEQINQIRKQYGHCDDGSIAEGISAAVARNLVSHWDTLPALDKLIRQDRGMKSFVLWHLDSTLDTTDTGKIVSLAKASCPPDLKKLCADLKKGAADAFK